MFDSIPEPAAGPGKIRVVGLSGSLRDGSYTTAAVKVALEGARELGAETQLINLHDYQLLFADEIQGIEPPGVVRLRKDVRSAHGILLGTPEYHGSFSGVLKNALDLMGFDEFEGKMIGLIGVSGGRTGAFDALNSLRNIGRALHAWVVPDQVGIAEASKVFNRAGQLQNLEAEERLRTIGRQVTRFARLHESGRAREFVESWEVALENPGG